MEDRRQFVHRASAAGPPGRSSAWVFRAGTISPRVAAAFVAVALAPIIAGSPAMTLARLRAPTISSQAVTDVGLATPTLCASVAVLDELVVLRTDAFPQDHVHFAFPAKTVVRSPTAARSAARALCALPAMPKGVFSCPADFGIVYRSSFSAAHRGFPIVRVDATGCEVVDGLTPLRWVARSPGFWKALGASLGLRNADRQTFAGTMPT